MKVCAAAALLMAAVQCSLLDAAGASSKKPKPRLAVLENAPALEAVDTVATQQHSTSSLRRESLLPSRAVKCCLCSKAEHGFKQVEIFGQRTWIATIEDKACVVQTANLAANAHLGSTCAAACRQLGGGAVFTDKEHAGTCARAASRGGAEFRASECSSEVLGGQCCVCNKPTPTSVKVNLFGEEVWMPSTKDNFCTVETVQNNQVSALTCPAACNKLGGGAAPKGPKNAKSCAEAAALGGDWAKPTCSPAVVGECCLCNKKTYTSEVMTLFGHQVSWPYTWDNACSVETVDVPGGVSAKTCAEACETVGGGAELQNFPKFPGSCVKAKASPHRAWDVPHCATIRPGTKPIGATKAAGSGPPSQR
jgi:hypothetical protein